MMSAIKSFHYCHQLFLITTGQIKDNKKESFLVLRQL